MDRLGYAVVTRPGTTFGRVGGSVICGTPRGWRWTAWTGKPWVADLSASRYIEKNTLDIRFYIAYIVT